MLTGAYDTEVYAPEPIIQNDFTRSLLLIIADVARDLYSFKQTVKTHGKEFLRKIEIYDFMKYNMRGFLQALEIMGIDVNRGLEALHTILSHMALDKVLGERTHILGRGIYMKIINIIDNIWNTSYP